MENPEKGRAIRAGDKEKTLYSLQNLWDKCHLLKAFDRKELKIKGIIKLKRKVSLHTEGRRDLFL
jgi:hypothetical protein